MAKKKVTKAVKNEERKFLSLMKKLGVKVDTFTEPQYIYSKAIEYGAVVEHCIKRANFAFDKKGKFVGSSDEGANSFNRRGSSKNE